MSAWTESPRVDVDGYRRPLELTAKLRQAVEDYVPMPKWGLERVDALMFHLYWGDLALCGTRATREPAFAPESPFLCGACAWKFEIASSRDLVE
ncbi:MAG: hypothetical protein IIA92_13700 [Chloroflexi bacterium]|nr:hypothetical protein [Chloroflexota bacterium]